MGECDCWCHAPIDDEGCNRCHEAHVEGSERPDARAPSFAQEETVETITLTPEWESTCEWFARALREHAFDKDAREPIVSFIEQVRYLALTDPAALERIMERLK